MRCARCGDELHVADEFGTLVDAEDGERCPTTLKPHCAATLSVDEHLAQQQPASDYAAAVERQRGCGTTTGRRSFGVPAHVERALR